MIKTYQELIHIPTFKERFEYLKLPGIVGKETFGHNRYLNQDFYTSNEWKRIRSFVIARDLGRDLGVEGYDLYNGLVVHHINPITMDDIINHSDIVFDPENLITTCLKTHNAIHYGDFSQVVDTTYVPRQPNDTCPWRW